MRRKALMMSGTLVILGLFLGSLQAAVPPIEFGAPSYDSPGYALRMTFAVMKERAVFVDLTLNGASIRNVFVTSAGKQADLTKPLTPGFYEVFIPYAWKSKKPYKAVLLYRDEKGTKDKTFEWAGTAPGQGGIPEKCDEGFFWIYKVEETAGLGRKGEIAYVTLTAPKADIEKANFSFFDGGQAVPYQIIDVRESTPPESQSKTHPVTLTCKMALPLDAAPGQKKLLMVFLGGGGPSAEKGFSISGEGFGKTIASSRLSLSLHPKSGQINIIEYPAEKIKLHNEKAGVVHWNPDVFVPGIAWDHSFDWNPPQSLAEKDGAFVYINARKGPLPRVADVFLEVKYTLEKDAPYVISETRMTVTKDLGVVALRNDEMVLYKRLFDTLMYKDLREGVVKRPLLELPGMPFGLAHIAEADAEWVGLANTMMRYGFFSVRLNAANVNLDLSGDFAHRSGTYFYAPSDGEYVYWVRPLLYTWADVATSNHLTFLPKGSSFYEKNAYILLPLDEKTPDVLDELSKRLKNPLWIY